MPKRSQNPKNRHGQSKDPDAPISGTPPKHSKEAFLSAYRDQGFSMFHATHVTGIPRRTVNSWLGEPEFAQALEDLRDEFMDVSHQIINDQLSWYSKARKNASDVHNDPTLKFLETDTVAMKQAKADLKKTLLETCAAEVDRARDMAKFTAKLRGNKFGWKEKTEATISADSTITDLLSGFVVPKRAVKTPKNTSASQIDPKKIESTYVPPKPI